jgi:NAD(P)-dependent dehydrogenase (short-subunit alcohol dehydrogenase family)
MNTHPEGYSPAPDLLKDRIILVTGAGSGIGATAAQAFAAHGATVVLVGRAMRKLEAVYDHIEAAGHPQPAIYPLNLEKAGPAEYEALAERLGAEFGRLDGLLHNAANPGTLTPLSQYPVEQWSKVMQANLNAPFMMTQALIELMRQSSDASLLFTSADVGRQGRAYWGAYGIAYGAVENMMQVWAAELETNATGPHPVSSSRCTVSRPLTTTGRITAF